MSIPDPDLQRPKFDVAWDPWFSLEVSGTRRKTRKSILTWSSRYFQQILDGPFKPEEGELLLDCDVAAFDYVLYFFRHHRLPEDAPTEKVRDVAKMYSVDELLEETDRRLEIENSRDQDPRCPRHPQA